jgi:hypothetical protein
MFLLSKDSNSPLNSFLNGFLGLMELLEKYGGASNTFITEYVICNISKMTTDQPFF